MFDSVRNGYDDKPKRMYFIVVVLKYCFESRFSTCNKKYICKNAIDILMKKINSTKKESRCSRHCHCTVHVIVPFMILYCSCHCTVHTIVLFMSLYCSCYCTVHPIILFMLVYCSCLLYCSCYCTVHGIVLFMYIVLFIYIVLFMSLCCSCHCTVHE